MKKFLLFLLVSIITLPAFSDAIWQEIQGKDKTLYVDTSSITNKDAQYLYWVKSNTQNGYRKMLMKSDCANNLTGVQRVITYNNSNKVVKNENKNQELTYVVPDSDAQVAYNYICDIYQKEENKKKKTITPNKIFGTINSINHAGYEVNSIKNNAVNIINGF